MARFRNDGRRKLIISDGEVPEGALSLRELRDPPLRDAWRVATSHHFVRYSRCIALAWRLDQLVNRDGYAFATDAYLARKTNLLRTKVSEALGQMEIGGAIIRAHVDVGQQWMQRRIFLAREIISTMMVDTPSRYTPRDGDTEHNLYSGGAFDDVPSGHQTDKAPWDDTDDGSGSMPF